MRGLNRVLGFRGRRPWRGWGLAGAALVCVVAPVAFAQVVPPSLDACAKEPDSGKRLACFDREIARLHQVERSQSSGKPAAGAAPNTEGSRSAGAASSAQAGDSAAPAPPAPSAPSTGAVAGAEMNDRAAIDRFGVTPDMQRQREIQGKAPTPLREITAHITSVHYLPRGEIVVGLDNGQTWQQAEYDGDVNWDVGEAVTIKAGALSSFYLKPHRGRIVRVKRLR